MKPISKTATNVHESATLAVDALAKKLKAAGEDVVGFGAGEPDFRTPEHICQAAIRAIKDGMTKYTPASGLEQLKKSVCTRFKNDFDLDYTPAQIVIASGAKHSIFVALMCLLNPGDEVIIQEPYWVTYYEAIEMAGGVPVVINTIEENRFKVTADQIEKAITDKTKLFLLNNPSNPSGVVYTREELKAIADICVKYDLYIISDEIYYKLMYDGKEFTSFASLGEDVKERTIIVNGISKSYAMTGWRIGYTASNKELAKVMANYLSHSTSAPSTISQYAAIEALEGDQDSIEDMRKVFEERRNYIVSRVQAIDGLSCLVPDGAFYLMVNIEKQIGRTIGGKLIQNGDDFALALLEQEKVALVPCTSFGLPNYVRLTYATSIEEIGKGLDRIEEFVK